MEYKLNRIKIKAQDLCNQLGVPIARDEVFGWFYSDSVPFIECRIWMCETNCFIYLEEFFDIQWDGDWEDSLHLPKKEMVEGKKYMVWNTHSFICSVRPLKTLMDSSPSDTKFVDGDSGCFWEYWAEIDLDLIDKPIKDWPKELQRRKG